MFITQSFSSLIELNNSNLVNTSRDLLNGLKIYHNNQWYICGNLALNEGRFPHKIINSSPADLDYQLLTKAALLVSHESIEQPLTLTLGFPYATYRVYKDQAAEFFQKSVIIEYDGSVFGKDVKKTVIVDIENVEVIPEIVGCAIALRKGEENATGNFFVLSCGFGTFESVLSTDAGVNEQSMVSTHGLKYAINIVLTELSKTHNLNFMNAHLLDEAFQSGYIILGRQKIDFREIRKEALRAYYNEVLSVNLRSVITDANLMKANKIYLCGGGMYYQDLVDCFKNEFGEIATLVFVNDPSNLASKGYALNSLRKSGGKEKSSLGIDIGNATTIVTGFGA
jgi:plasmid segregation protein ParM